MPLPHSDETLLIFANVGTYMHVCMYNQPHINNTHMNQTTLQDTSGSYQGRWLLGTGRSCHGSHLGATPSCDSEGDDEMRSAAVNVEERAVWRPVLHPQVHQWHCLAAVPHSTVGRGTITVWCVCVVCMFVWCVWCVLHVCVFVCVIVSDYCKYDGH